MPQRILQKTADVDCAPDMALVALSLPDSRQPELVGLAQWVSESNGESVPRLPFKSAMIGMVKDWDRCWFED